MGRSRATKRRVGSQTQSHSRQVTPPLLPLLRPTQAPRPQPLHHRSSSTTTTCSSIPSRRPLECPALSSRLARAAAGPLARPLLRYRHSRKWTRLCWKRCRWKCGGSWSRRMVRPSQMARLQAEKSWVTGSMVVHQTQAWQHILSTPAHAPSPCRPPAAAAAGSTCPPRPRARRQRRSAGAAHAQAAAPGFLLIQPAAIRHHCWRAGCCGSASAAGGAAAVAVAGRPCCAC